MGGTGSGEPGAGSPGPVGRCCAAGPLRRSARAVSGRVLLRSGPGRTARRLLLGPVVGASSGADGTRNCACRTHFVTAGRPGVRRQRSAGRPHIARRAVAVVAARARASAGRIRRAGWYLPGTADSRAVTRPRVQQTDPRFEPRQTAQERDPGIERSRGPVPETEVTRTIGEELTDTMRSRLPARQPAGLP